MSRRLLAVVAGGVAVVAAACTPIKPATPQPELVPPPPAAAELTSDPVGADLVATATEPEPTQAFSITNTGGETTEALFSFFTAPVCCTVSPDFDTVTSTCDATVLAPGESCTVAIAYTGVSGSTPSSIVLVVKEPLPAKAEVRVTITGQFVS